MPKEPQPSPLPFRWKKASFPVRVLRLLSLPGCILFCAVGLYDQILAKNFGVFEVLFFLFGCYLTSGFLHLLVTFLLFAIFPAVPELPEGSGLAELPIVRDSLGRKFIQGFGGRELHELSRRDQTPFAFRIDCRDHTFGENMCPIGSAQVEFTHTGWTEHQFPMFRSFRSRLDMRAKWPTYSYKVVELRYRN